MTFKDHFSSHSEIYAKYRPVYPEALYRHILKYVKSRNLAWDCGTGNGQVAIALAPHFDKVVATDASENQIRHAAQHKKIEYRIVPAEHSGLPANTTELTTVGQAMHWFDFDKFYEEVRRVSKPDGLLAIWSYGLHRINPQIDRVINYFYLNVVGQYWPPERKHIDEGYETIPFPFESIPSPDINIHAEWFLDELLGYLNTWSATQRFIQQEGNNPVDLVAGDLKKAWGAENKRRKITWPLLFKGGWVK